MQRERFGAPSEEVPAADAASARQRRRTLPIRENRPGLREKDAGKTRRHSLRTPGIREGRTENQGVHAAIEEKMERDIASVSGDELKGFFKLKYNPEVLLMNVAELKNEMAFMPDLGSRLYNGFFTNANERLYDVVIENKKEFITRRYGEKTLAALQHYLEDQFGISLGAEVPTKVREWYRAKLSE
jgi:hypothetical protein